MTPEEAEFSCDPADEAESAIDEFPGWHAIQISLCEQAERGLKAIIRRYRIDERLTETTTGAFQGFLSSAQSDEPC
jgi:hypothetical protein